MRILRIRCRRIANRALWFWLRSDREDVRKRVDGYRIPAPISRTAAERPLARIRRAFPGFTCGDPLDRWGQADTPFVYEQPSAPHLQRLREAFPLEAVVAGASDEYEGMLRLGTWLGSRWDHGEDAVPGGAMRIDWIKTLEAGQGGSKFWCEIAAKVAVQVFAAMGWQARLATTSRDGYTWEHAVVEIWSNRFAKWFAMDTDFNLLYEADGVPLSAFELCHRGPALAEAGRLRTRALGPPKPSLPRIDLLPFFAYIHIDLRSDWQSRPLRWGSPAGGDLATWWTARPGFERLASPKPRLDDGGRFDWPVNIAWIRLEKMAVDSGAYRLQGSLLAYSPCFASFQTSVDAGSWLDAPMGKLDLSLAPGEHTVAVRLLLRSGAPGWARSWDLRLPPLPGVGPARAAAETRTVTDGREQAE